MWANSSSVHFDGNTCKHGWLKCGQRKHNGSNKQNYLNTYGVQTSEGDSIFFFDLLWRRSDENLEENEDRILIATVHRHLLNQFPLFDTPNGSCTTTSWGVSLLTYSLTSKENPCIKPAGNNHNNALDTPPNVQF